MPHDDLSASVRNVPAAMVGTVIATELEGHGPFGDMVRTRISVEKWVKADLGDTIDIRTVADGGGACGLGWMDAGTRLGLLLTVEGDALTSNLCMWVDADELAQVNLADDSGVPPMSRDDVRVTWDSASSPLARVVFLSIIGVVAGAAMIAGYRRRQASQVPE